MWFNNIYFVPPIKATITGEKLLSFWPKDFTITGEEHKLKACTTPSSGPRER